LSRDIKFLGVAPGNDNKQVAAYKKQFHISFPVVPDKEGEAYYTLGIPTLPFMVITNTEGKVLLSHRGIIGDLDQMLKEIKEIHEKH
jgi:hypothetical protein